MTKEQYELILRRIYGVTCVYTIFIGINILKVLKDPIGNTVPFSLNLINYSISIINILCLLCTIRVKLKHLAEGKAELIEFFYNAMKKEKYSFETLLGVMYTNCMTKMLKYKRIKVLFFVNAIFILISNTYMLINKSKHIIKNDIIFFIIVFAVVLLTIILIIKTEKKENKLINDIASGVNLSMLGVNNPVDVLEDSNEKVKAN